MLLELAKWLQGHVNAFHLFQYITFRSIMSALTALAVSLLAGPALIRRLASLKAGQVVREDGPQTHLSKAGTPTMGGMLILLAIAAGNAAVGGPAQPLRLDRAGRDSQFRRHRLLGRLSQAGVSRTAAAWPRAGSTCCSRCSGWARRVLLYHTAQLPVETALFLPLFKQVVLPLGMLFVVIAYLMIVGFSNAVNLTDGLDGLAIMPSVLVAGALGIFAYLSGNAVFSEYLGIPAIPGAGELAIFTGAIAGAGLGFLWFNTYPAQVFMGDIGALSIGAALGCVAVIVRQEIVLLVMGGVFVVETASVMLQVASFKLTGKRMFRMAPIHHHFELKGWPEPRVIVRFWIISVVLVLVGLATLKVR